ncbi:unnamed protein product, partial [Closterium sp. NIES-53]
MGGYPTRGYHMRGYHVAGYHITSRQTSGISGNKPRQIGSTRVSVVDAADVAGESSESSQSAGDVADVAKGEAQQQFLSGMSDPGSNPSGGINVILGIETSCDDTGAAVVTSDGRILGEALASQGKVHAEWGGVVPSLARGEHEKAIDPVVQAALEEAGLQPSDLSAVAVTIGPGLSLCLRVGVMKARRLAAQHGIPIIPIHHMEAHALVARQTWLAACFPCPCLPSFFSFLSPHPPSTRPFRYPWRVSRAVISPFRDFRQTWLAACFPCPCPPSFFSSLSSPFILVACFPCPRLPLFFSIPLPLTTPIQVPLARVKSCDFSFSGLKANVARCIQKEAPAAQTIPIAEATPEDRQLRADIAASFQEVAVLHLQSRVQIAMQIAGKSTPAIDTLVMAGGVASNQVVRTRIAAVCEQSGLRLVCPPPRLCTDN